MKTKISLMNDPEYRQCWEKLQSLNLELGSTEKRIDKLHRRIQDDDTPDFLTDQAERYLKGEAINQKTSTYRDQVLELYHQRSVIRRAIEVQRKKLQGLRSSVSENICRSVRPEYAAIVKKHVELIKKLAAVADEERELRLTMEAEDLAWKVHIPPMPLFGLGSLKDKTSFASRFLREAEEHEYI